MQKPILVRIGRLVCPVVSRTSYAYVCWEMRR